MCDESDSHTRAHRSLSGFCCGSTQAARQGCFFPLRPSSFRGHRYGCFHDGAAASFFSGDTWADSTEGFVVGNPVTTTGGLGTP